VAVLVSSNVLALEALVSSSGRPVVGDAVLTTHHRRMIVDLCAQPRSVAEVAALLSVPLGVARVLLGDLAGAGRGRRPPHRRYQR
jgi:predicted kinase